VADAARHGAVALPPPAPGGGGDGLAQLKAITREARLLLVGDSGPRWFAAAFGVPCVCVMGPNFPEVTATSLERCEIVRVSGLECAPCLRRRCPLGHHRCMRDVAVETVAEAAERVLARGAAAG
jgi:heptosyltransferase-2